MSPAAAATSDRSGITALLLAWREGSRSALDRLVPLVEADLRLTAHRYLRRERAGLDLQTTALVNEAYARLLAWRGVSWQNRAHFFAMAARFMRHVLVDLSRRRARQPDGRPILHVAVDEAQIATRPVTRDLLAIDEALRKLAARDARKAQIVELRYFGGLTLEEVAETIGVAPITVSREWAKARAWLHQEVTGRGIAQRPPERR